MGADATITPTTDSQPKLTETEAEIDDGGALQSTLAAFNVFADATFTADALGRRATPTATLAGVQPVGVRERPVLHPALQAVKGELVYFAKRETGADSEPVFEIVTLDLVTWETRRFGAGGGSSTYPQPSPDGRWIAFQSDVDGDFEVYLVNRLGGQLRQLTQNTLWDRLPSWSPDGNWIIYSSDARGDQTFDLYRVRSDGVEQLPEYSDGWRNSHARYSPDGNTIVFTAGAQVRDASTWEIRLLDRQSGNASLLTENDIRDASPVFSPHGQRIMYVTSISGVRALASMSPIGGDREVLFTGPGSVWAASFSPDGDFIVVTATRNGEDQLFLMDAAGGNVQQITSSGGAYASWIPRIVE